MNPPDHASAEKGSQADGTREQQLVVTHADSETDQLTSAPEASPEVTNSNEETSDPEYVDIESPDDEWQLWPPSPKMQIILIAVVFGLFNLLLIGIWAAVMVYRF